MEFQIYIVVITISIHILAYCLASRDPEQLNNIYNINIWFGFLTLSSSLQLLAWHLYVVPLPPPGIKSEWQERASIFTMLCKAVAAMSSTRATILFTWKIQGLWSPSSEVALPVPQHQCVWLSEHSPWKPLVDLQEYQRRPRIERMVLCGTSSPLGCQCHKEDWLRRPDLWSECRPDRCCRERCSNSREGMKRYWRHGVLRWWWRGLNQRWPQWSQLGTMDQKLSFSWNHQPYSTRRNTWFLSREKCMHILQSVPQQPRDLACLKSLPCRHLWQADLWCWTTCSLPGFHIIVITSTISEWYSFESACSSCSMLLNSKVSVASRINWVFAWKHSVWFGTFESLSGH